jgi:hypothetical protein
VQGHDLQEARAWYDNIRRELGERFALTIEAMETIPGYPLRIPVVYGSRRRAGGTNPQEHKDAIVNSLRGTLMVGWTFLGLLVSSGNSQ